MSPISSPPTAAVIVVSDRIADGTKSDSAADIAIQLLKDAGIWVIHREVIREVGRAIACALDAQLGQHVTAPDIIITLGGTGTRPGNVVPEITMERIAARMHGLETQVLLKGLQSSDKAGLCRGVIGVTNYGHPAQLIINSAGSRGAVRDTLEVIVPLVGDIFRECSTKHTHGISAVG